MRIRAEGYAKARQPGPKARIVPQKPFTGEVPKREAKNSAGQACPVPLDALLLQKKYDGKSPTDDAFCWRDSV